MGFSLMLSWCGWVLFVSLFAIFNGAGKKDTNDAIKYFSLFPLSSNGHSVASSFIKTGREIIILSLMVMTLHDDVYLTWYAGNISWGG